MARAFLRLVPARADHSAIGPQGRAGGALTKPLQAWYHDYVMPAQYATRELDDFTCNVSCEEYYGDGDSDVERYEINLTPEEDAELLESAEAAWLKHCEEFAQALERERAQEIEERNRADTY